MALDGITLDLDGTLVDTNEMHVRAWRAAFESRGYKIAEDRIRVEVGKGGDKLVPDILGEEADHRDGDHLREQQPKEFEKLAKAGGIKPFAKAKELLDALRKRNLRTALVTSSNEKHLETIEKYSKLQVRRLVDQVITSDDAKNSKPASDPLTAACRKLKLSPAQCASIGDTIYDATSARSAGVVCIGLLTGYNSAEQMRSAGARITYRDIAELHDQLDDALDRASPGESHLTQDAMESLMRQALDMAREAMQSGEAPIACLLARGDGTTIVAKAHNEQNATQNKAAHAEIVAFADAAGKVPLDARDLILVSTLEPCVMCTGAAMISSVDTILFALRAPADAGSQRVQCPASPESQMPRIVGDVLADESRKLFEEFLKTNPRDDQRRFVEQLLRTTR